MVAVQRPERATGSGFDWRMDGSAKLSDPDVALTTLLAELERRGYDFTPPTPATHRRVIARRATARTGDLRDVLGWSLPFQTADAPVFLIQALRAADLLAELGDGLARSRVRVARLKGRLFLHSAFPTVEKDSVFLGPDSYRFADFILRELDASDGGRIVDVGGGAGVGALTAALAAPGADLTMTDINPMALRLARINAAHAGAALSMLRTSGLDGVAPGASVVLANPPYMADSGQSYRDGGRPARRPAVGRLGEGRAGGAGAGRAAAALHRQRHPGRRPR
ncbi:methyltransferase [Phenylobacterium sp. J426]|uniref:methyltransferase n=1 Tax=Phenylobacterium sp. J426 TaxID=2898439 RepID=UPI002150D991|nr:methyltransferase [Phenylobacterium sp. J426]MCR5872900.1 methyltransferase [Phenylobacterium sp. J426]